MRSARSSRETSHPQSARAARAPQALRQRRSRRPSPRREQRGPLTTSRLYDPGGVDDPRIHDWCRPPAVPPRGVPRPLGVRGAPPPDRLRRADAHARRAARARHRGRPRGVPQHGSRLYPDLGHGCVARGDRRDLRERGARASPHVCRCRGGDVLDDPGADRSRRPRDRHGPQLPVDGVARDRERSRGRRPRAPTGGRSGHSTSTLSSACFVHRRG